MSENAAWFVYTVVLPTLKLLGIGFSCGLLLEWLLPAHQKQSMASRLRGVAFWALYVVIGGLLGVVAHKVMAFLQIRPLLSVDLSHTQASNSWLVWLLSFTVLPFAGLLVFDFFYYWFHRLQHSFPILWRFHSTHHSIRELNAINNYHHVLEDAFRLPLLLIPMTFLAGVSPPQTALATLLMGIAGVITHSNTRLSYGPLRFILVEPIFHRLHHSIAAEHWNRNFAFYFSFWDIVFRTATFPKPGEAISTGLSEQSEPMTLKEFLVPPAQVAAEDEHWSDTLPRLTP